MAVYYKPQSPIQSGEDFIYPLTTADQVILSDGSRLEKNGQISIGGGTVKTVSGIAPDSAGNVALGAANIGAATAGEVSQLKSDKLDKTATAADASKLGGKTLAEIMLTLYPVGSIYMSVSATSPASLFGGTWEQLKDRFLVGAGSTYSAGSTGGEATHTLSINEIPSHAGHLYGNAGQLNGKGDAKGKWLAEVKNNGSSTSYGWNYANNEYYPVNRSLGDGAAHNNMPPYLAVYMWRRVS